MLIERAPRHIDALSGTNHRAASSASGHRSSLMHHEDEPAKRIGMTPDNRLLPKKAPGLLRKQDLQDAT
jgi:hypothetical protein